jgi:uncharacterized damage-inducible protein DinB
MARNDAWADVRLLNACSQLTDDAYPARRTRFFPSIHLTLNHILVVHWHYLDALDNGGRRWREIHALDDAPCPTFADLRREQTATDRRLMAYCDQLRAACLDAPNDPARAGRPAVCRADPGRARAPVPARHHHRGPVHAMLARTDLAPPQLDEFFLQQDAPLRTDDLCALELPQR